MAVEAKVAAYLWFPRDFAGDEPVQLMTLEEEGAYRRLLDHQWLHGSVPAGITELAKICKNLHPKKMAAMWKAIAPCFIESDGRLQNRRLERVRADAEAYRRKQSASGKAGAEARWGGGDPNGGANSGANSGAMATPMANECLPSPSPSPAPVKSNDNDDSARAKDPIIGSVRHLALSDAMTSTDYRSALEGFLRAAHDPYRLLSELEAVVSGASGPGGRPVTPDVIGRAMHDMLVANVTQMTTRRLAAFIRGVLEPPAPRQRQPVDDDEGEFVRAGRKLEAEDAARRAAVRHG